MEIVIQFRNLTNLNICLREKYLPKSILTCNTLNIRLNTEVVESARIYQNQILQWEELVGREHWIKLFEGDCFQMTAALCHNCLRSILNHYKHVAALGEPF